MKVRPPGQPLHFSVHGYSVLVWVLGASNVSRTGTRLGPEPAGISQNSVPFPLFMLTVCQRGLANRLCLQAPHRVSVTVTTSTVSLMRLAEFPVDTLYMSWGGGGGGQDGMEQRRRAVESGEFSLSRTGINRTPGTAGSEPGSPESTYHRGPPVLVTARPGPPGSSQGCTSQMRSSIRHLRRLKGRWPGWLARNLSAIMT